MSNIVEYEATPLRGNRWCVRPKGQLGTIGWSPLPWTAVFVTARTPEVALKRATMIASRALTLSKPALLAGKASHHGA